MKKSERDRLYTEYLVSAESYGIPENLSKVITRKIVFGHSAGGFITAVFRNDLTGAIMAGRTYEINALKPIIEFIHREVPFCCTRPTWKGF